MLSKYKGGVAMTEVTKEDLMLVLEGKCPYCKQLVKDWQAPSGRFAPEMWESLRDYNINPSTGHKNNCDAPQKKGR